MTGVVEHKPSVEHRNANTTKLWSTDKKHFHARRESWPSRVEETIEEEATMLISARVLGHNTGLPKTRGRVTPPDSAHKLNIPITANPRWRYAAA